MNLIIVGLLLWAASAIVRQISAYNERKHIEKLQEEQARIREAERENAAWQKRQAQINRENAQRQAEHERQIARQRQAQARLKAEQERQAKQIAKHEDMIARLEQQSKRAESDIEFLNQRTAELYAQLDYELMKQSATTPGSAEFEKHQRKVVTLHNQIHAAESRLANAEYRKEQAQRKLT